MKAFLLKHKQRIIFLIVLFTILFFLVPLQKQHYLDFDIKNFKKIFLIPILFWAGVVTTIGLFILLLVKMKSFIQAGIYFFYTALFLAWFFFIFQDIFLGTALFLNRLYKKDGLQKAYVVKMMNAADSAKGNFFPYDLAAQKIVVDRKLINSLYKSGLKQGDTVILKLNKGLFGIPFQSTPFDDK